ncbi:hypothetical protein BP00DRAFT_451499 [Aspergillus indologenus CBS 114.80]|uniref:2EXR domain-containing protein n=1 Tax=Aspergillus indologenus CBS 114.80 TaxID=1450541 RepID=A0A2V5HWW2_9EURO|nr:hypothetical protein BP00DRAFT_451499 [Aspergillus indologenus CBS 114.80]
MASYRIEISITLQAAPRKSPRASFARFPNLPWELRDLIWLFSLDELALSWKPRELDSRDILYPLKQRNWQPRDATGPMSDREEDIIEEAKERQLPLYQYRRRIPHFGVNREARAAASRWASKQEAGWLAAHQGCADPRRCARTVDRDRQMLLQPRLPGFCMPVVDGLFLSESEYERCCNVLGRDRPGEQDPPAVNWKRNLLWNQPVCKKNRPIVPPHAWAPLVVTLALLRRDPNALRNFVLWDGGGQWNGGILEWTRAVVVIVNDLPHHGERMTVQQGWTMRFHQPTWKRVDTGPWRSECRDTSESAQIDPEARGVIEHAISQLDQHLLQMVVPAYAYQV